MALTIVLKGEPLSTQHIYKNNGRGGRFMSSEAAALKEDYGWQARAAYRDDPISGPVKLRIDFYFSNNRKRDLDDHNKIVLDALNHIVYNDDKQIDDLRLVRHCDPSAG